MATLFISESDGGNHYKVSGLLPKTVYNIRVRARNLGSEVTMQLQMLSKLSLLLTYLAILTYLAEYPDNLDIID